MQSWASVNCRAFLCSARCSHAMCGAMQSSAMHKLVRRGLLLRDELGRPQWAAISNNLPSLGSTQYSQLQCVALPKNYPHYPRTTQCTSAVVGLSLEWWPFVRRHLESPGWGRGCRHYLQWIGGGAKQKMDGRNQNLIFRQRFVQNYKTCVQLTESSSRIHNDNSR